MLPITIALVRPSSADPARIASASKWVKEISDAFRSSMKTDLEKLLIAKGFKVTGPYETLDAMTFPEKKVANLTLTPIIDIRSESQITQNREAMSIIPGHQEGLFVVGGWVALTMLEPLSGEKMWLKRIEIESVSEPYAITYNLVTVGNQQRQNILSDTRPQALTMALNKIYPIIMQQAWTYFHPEEIMNINQQANEVRERKRY